MTEDRRQKRGCRPEAAGGRRTSGLQPKAYSLLALCLCILALRVTYTEAPTAQMLLTPGSLGDTLYSLTLSGLLLFAFVIWLLWRILGDRLVYRITGMEIGLVLLAAAAVASTVGASDKRTAITQSVTLLSPICAALLLVQLLDSPARVRVVLTVIAALGVVSAYQCAEQLFVSNAVTIEQYEKQPELLLGPLGIEPGTFQHFLFEHRLYSRGIRGPFTTSNSAASFAILASFAALALLARRIPGDAKQRSERKYDWLLALGTLVIVAGLLLTRSKGGILAFFCGLVLFAGLMAAERWPAARKRLALGIVIPLVVVLVVAAASAAVVYGLNHDRLPGGNSMLVRWQYWAASARMYADHTLTGVGPGNFSDYYPHYKPPAALESVSDPHNFLLSLLTQYGPLGLLGFLAMVLVPLWSSVTFPRHAAATDGVQTPPFRTLALGMLSLVVACLLLVRPLLMPPSQVDEPGVLLYEIITLYLAPAAAFFIGFLLLSAPLEDRRGWQNSHGHAALSAALISAALAVLLHNLVDFALFEPGVWTTFWFLLASLIASHLRQSGGRSLSIRGVPLVKAAAVAVAFVLLGAYLWLVWKPVYNTTIAIRQAQQAVATGHFDRAHQVLNAAMDVDPLSPVIPNVSGRMYLQDYEQASSKQPTLLEEAVRGFQRAIDRSPEDYKNYEKLAIVYGRMGEKQKTYDWYLKATQLYPGCDRLWLELGKAAEQLGKPDAAIGYYGKAVEIEDAYRRQFRQMYPRRDKIVSRLGEADYQFAQQRIRELSGL